MFELLSDSPLFRGISADEFSSLMKRVKHHIRQFRTGELLAQAGEKVDKAILLIDGRLQGEMIDFAGNSLKIEELDPPQMVAAAFLFGPHCRFPVYLSAITDGKILIIPKSDFISMLSMEPRVMENYLNIVSGKAQFLSNKISILSLKTIREKIAYFLLLKMKSSNNKEILIQQSQTNLAEFFGVTRPSLSRSILEMEKLGILSWTRDKVRILDLAKLNQILGQ